MGFVPDRRLHRRFDSGGAFFGAIIKQGWMRPQETRQLSRRNIFMRRATINPQKTVNMVPLYLRE
jgi:hypothetical protein